ncbi:MAG: TetR/AcrR family transcriptional regulator [Gammaproteobacteria bacterium]|jgi:AcrR family transcriptional regulator
MDTIITPRQERSQQTQEKLLDALEFLLRERYFEHITIQDIAAQAGVAVGTVYRRFRNKEALLPVLYARLDTKMADWAATVWQGFSPSSRADGGLREAIRTLVAAHLRFYESNTAILRTIYLQTRLDKGLVDAGVADRRRRLYETLLEPLWACFERAGQSLPSPARARCFILLLLSPLTERCLFPDNTPASALATPEDVFVEEITEALFRYLGQADG